VSQVSRTDHRSLMLSREIDVVEEVDVVVCGGGPAGLAAAISAARGGAKTLLVERYGFLGGNFTAASVGTLCGLYFRTESGFDFAVTGFAKELSERLQKAGSAMGPVPFKETAVLLYVPWAAKRMADELVCETENLELLLHCRAADVVVESDADKSRIEGVVLSTKRGLWGIRAKTYVDATGDGDIAFYAGVPTEVGPSGQRQFASMQFIIQNADGSRALPSIQRLSEIIAEHGQDLTRDSGALIPTGRPGEFVGAMTRITRDGEPLDATDPYDQTYGELEGRKVVESTFEFVKKHVPGFENSFLQDTPAQLGVRESRRIKGKFVLEKKHLIDGTKFDDAIATGAWPLEFHVRGKSTEYEFFPPGHLYHIPFRSLIPNGVENLLVAGRCISATHEALASTRVMAPCMAIGQAAGTAAAIASRSSVEVTAVSSRDIQDALREGGVQI
jgi:hypothetical protein